MFGGYVGGVNPLGAQSGSRATAMEGFFSQSSNLFSALGFGNFAQMQTMSQMVSQQTQVAMAQLMQGMLSQPADFGNMGSMYSALPGASAQALQGYTAWGGLGMGADQLGGMMPFGGSLPFGDLFNSNAWTSGTTGGLSQQDLQWKPEQGYFRDDQRYIGPAHVNPTLQAYGIPNSSSLPPRTQAFLTAALSKQGKPYVPGACGPSGYDCSGLVRSALKDVGIANPPAAARFQQSAYPAVSKENLKPGDLVYFWFPNNRGIEPPKASHVEIYLGNGTTMATDGRTNPSRIKDMNWKAFIGANRVPELQQ